MELLDARLGGTIPLDVILSAPDASSAMEAEQPSNAEETDWDEEGGFFDEAFDIDFSFGASSDAETSYWFSVPGRQLIDHVHGIIDDREASGKVMSLSTAFAVMDRLYGSRLGGVELALIENSLPQDVSDSLITPFYNACCARSEVECPRDGNERIAAAGCVSAGTAGRRS